MAGDDMPQRIDFAERMLFLSLRCLYASYRAGTITREQAKDEKNRILNDYDTTRRWVDIYKETCDIRIKLDSFGKEIETGDCERCKRIMRIFDGREIN